MAPLLTARLDKRLETFSLAVAVEAGPGVTALVGPSGSGKTTLLRCLAGLTRPDGGRIALGERVFFDAAARIDLPAQARRVGLIFQDYALFSHMTVRENVAFGARRPEAVGELLDRLEIAPLAGRRPRQLSAGQQQRVAIARALASEPALLLMDEPFASLDPGLKERLYGEFSALVRASGLPVILVTHDWSEASRLADRLIVLDAGRVLQADTPEAVLYRPANENVARLSGVANVFVGEGTPEGLTFGAYHLPISVSEGRVRWCVRSDGVTLGPEGLPGVVAHVALTISGLRVTVDVAGAPAIEALVPRAQAEGISVGAPVGVRIAPGAVHVFETPEA